MSQGNGKPEAAPAPTIFDRMREGGQILKPVLRAPEAPITPAPPPIREKRTWVRSVPELNINTITLDRPLTNLYRVMSQHGGRYGSLPKKVFREPERGFTREQVKGPTGKLVSKNSIGEFVRRSVIIDIKDSKKYSRGLYTSVGNKLSYVPHMYASDIDLLQYVLTHAPNIKKSIEVVEYTWHDFMKAVNAGAIVGITK